MRAESLDIAILELNRASRMGEPAAQPQARPQPASPAHTYASLTNLRLVVPTQNTHFVAIEREFFIKLHHNSVKRVMVNEDWYLSRHPDVLDAVSAGRVTSGAEHYARFGYYEHRMPYQINVDENWYLQSHTDIRQAVIDGHFVSGQDHFDQLGFAEGRVPYRGFKLMTAPAT